MKTISLAAALLIGAEAAEFGYGGFSPSFYGHGHSYGHGHGHSHSHSHDDDDDDDEDDTPVDKSTWYNKYQQYSPIKFAYKPTTGKSTEYAICELSDNNKIQLAQLPGKAVQAKVNFTGLPGPNNYALRVFEYAALDCESLGDEFNPLQEKDSLGRLNPYQDQTRGRMADVATDDNGDVTDAVQKDILLNLEGPDQIIGRSIAVYQLNDEGILAATPQGCCVIGYDEHPELPADMTPTHHHHSSYRPSYPSYRGYRSFKPSYRKSFW